MFDDDLIVRRAGYPFVAGVRTATYPGVSLKTSPPTSAASHDTTLEVSPVDVVLMWF